MKKLLLAIAIVMLAACFGCGPDYGIYLVKDNTCLSTTH